MSTVLLSNECISWATSAAVLPGYDVAYSYHTLSWLLGSDTPPLPHSQLLPCILAGQEDECLLWDELCVGIREGKGQAGVCLWSLPNVYAQAMTSMKVWMIVSFAHIRIYGRMRKVMWRASSWRLFCWSAAAFMHEKMWLCDWCWCPGKEEKTRSCWRFPDGAFSCQRSQGYAYSVHIYIMTDGEKWKKHYISRGGGDALALLLLVVWLCEREELYTKSWEEKSHVFWLTKILKRSSAMRLVLL